MTTRLFPLLDESVTPVFYDLETGGTDRKHPTIQIAASVWDLQLVTELDSFERKLQFDVSLCDPKALKMNSYDPAAWQNEAVPAQVGFSDFFEWIDKNHRTVEKTSARGKTFRIAMAGGHNNTSFDWPRVERAFKKLGKTFIPIEFQQLDTLHIATVARAVGSIDVENLKLGTLIEALEVDVPTDGEGQHDALYDARAAALIARALLVRLMPGGAAAVHQAAQDAENDDGPELFGREERIV